MYFLVVVLTAARFFSVTAEPLNSDFMAREFSIQFGGMAFTKGELLVFQFTDPEKGKNFTLSLVVKNIEVQLIRGGKLASKMGEKGEF
ncbi:hypothetical protein NECAME_12150 [Necator americanus]|uniref:Uncharacterized protein n=1 Tax=Necator americanus TaxID=51031 RepID=W2T2K4_NECAM|nr:hypothetical protein NECAME_12150 [Necator americanus]ETN75764.1 hypothetical protein NECAME_12150 [Necator americanus]